VGANALGKVKSCALISRFQFMPNVHEERKPGDVTPQICTLTTQETAALPFDMTGQGKLLYDQLRRQMGQI
jgi:hypothetical protein